VAAQFAVREPRGEFVMLVECGGNHGANARGGSQQEVIEAALRKLLEEGVSVSSASRQVAAQLRVGRKGVYEAAQRMKDDSDITPAVVAPSESDGGTKGLPAAVTSTEGAL
jgi:uncharacterized protein YoaH (UPF0181 family)